MDCNLRLTKLLDCAVIGVCAVIRSDTVDLFKHMDKYGNELTLIEPITTAADNILKIFLSYDVAVIQWITSSYKNRMTTHYITLWREQVTS